MNNTIIVCITVVVVVFLLGSCSLRETEERTKQFQNRNEMERCVDICFNGWNTDEDCRNRCIDIYGGNEK